MTQTDQTGGQKTVWLTQDAYDKLTSELEDLKGPVRQEIIARIHFRGHVAKQLTGMSSGWSGVDTIAHTFLVVDSTQMSSRAMHEINVIGTMNLFAAATEFGQSLLPTGSTGAP